MFFENQANDQEHSYNQLCPNIRFSTCSVNTSPPFRVNSIPKKHHYSKTINVLELNKAFDQPEQPLSPLHQEFVAMI